MKYIATEQAREEIEKTNGNEFVLHYTKKDGSFRRIVCRLSIMRGGEENRISIYDTESAGVRVIYVSSIIAILFKGDCCYVNKEKVD